MISGKSINKLFLLLMLLAGVELEASESLSLEDCRKLALEHNHRIKIAENKIDAAEERSKASYSYFLPSFRFVGTYLYTNDVIGFKTPELKVPIQDMSSGQPQKTPYVFYMPEQDLELSKHNNYVMDLSMTQPVYTGGKISAQYDIAEKMTEIEKSNYSLEKAAIVAETDELFWKYIALQEKLKVAESYKALIDSVIYDLENYLEAGLITRNEILKAKVKLSDAKLNIFRVKNGLKLSAMALNQKLGRDLESGLSLEGEFNISDIDINSKSTVVRKEIEMLKSSVDISKSMETVNKSSYFPNVFFTAGYSAISPNIYNSLKSEFGMDWKVGLTVEYELFHFNKRGNQLQAAEIQTEISEIRLKEAEEMIRLDVSKSKIEISEARERIRLNEKTVEQAEENLRVSRDNFEEGLLTSSDLLEAQLMWEKAESDLIDAQADYMIKKTKLEKATGKLY